MIEKGSLTHNRCYPITGPQRRDAYESTVEKRIYRTHRFTLQESEITEIPKSNPLPRPSTCRKLDTIFAKGWLSDFSHERGHFYFGLTHTQ